MLAELGQVSLILALLLALQQSILPLWGSYSGNQQLQLLSRPLAYGMLAFIGLAFALLTAAFVSQDFSVEYVARNSNSLLPLQYRISAVWGGHEGSLLLWCLVLAIWIAAVARFSAALPLQFLARVSAVLGMVTVAFLLFILFTSNPFGRLLPMPPDGADLNPLLQDPGLIIHPPMLYMGYVGMAVPFAFAIAALLGGRLEAGWVRWCRPWTLTAWAFLTGGIALGSWWAYYELGWGGWWFWDPVENASFMPWLIGTALVHSLAVTEKRKVFQNWTLLLAISAFSLSLLGTFLVRSGALTSVHAFASDPTRGIFILAMLGFFAGGALLLFALRAHTLRPESGIGLYSRETMLLLNNVFFAAATGMVLLGTLYPLLAEALNMGKISVGPPYFGSLFIVLMIPVVVLMPLGPITRWRQGNWSELRQHARNMALAAAGIAVLLLLLLNPAGVRGWLGLIVAAWLMIGSIWYLWQRRRNRESRLGRWEFGMALAHFGVGVFVLGVSMVESSEIQKDLRMNVGDTVTVGAYDYHFADSQNIQGPNYLAARGVFAVSRSGSDDIIAVMQPEKRRYAAGGNIMTDAAIDPGLTRDLYVALGEPLDDVNPAQIWSVRIYTKPFVRWIWGGALFIMLGALLSATDRRYRLQQAASQASKQAEATAPTGAVSHA